MIPFLLAAVLQFPIASSPARPVSPPQWTNATGDQANAVVATNGTMTLAAWNDRRRSSDVFATRIAADGTILDPLGLLLPLISVDAAVWNGDDFAVFGRSAPNGDNSVVFVSGDGHVSASKSLTLDANYSFMAISSSDANARALYIRYDTSSSLVARVIDARGELVASTDTALKNALLSNFIAAGRENDFALISRSATVHLDRDGRVLNETAVLWPFQYFFRENLAATGHEGAGFVLARQDSETGDVAAYQLSEDAVFTGKSVTLATSPAAYYTSTHPLIAFDVDRYVVVAARAGSGKTIYWTTDLKADFTFTTRSHDMPLFPLLSGIAIAGGRRVVVSTIGGYGVNDPYVQTLSPALDPSEAVLLAVTATPQSNPSIAAAANGYAAAWLESGPDQYVRVYLRRFSTNGAALDPQPLEVAKQLRDVTSLYAPPPALVSNGDVDLVHGRRLNARTGEWIDASAIANVIAGASNGRDALILTPTAIGLGLQRIPLAGGLPSQVVPIAVAVAGSTARLASNGEDYLLVWSVVYPCVISVCPPQATPVLALRARADGTLIDRDPIALESNGWAPSVDWNGSSYLVSWTTRDGVRGTRISSEGANLDGRPVLEQVDANAYSMSSRVVAYNGDWLLFVSHTQGANRSWWTATRIPGKDTGLTGVAGLPRITLPFPFAAATNVAGRLIAAFVDSSDPSTAYVSRVYTQQFGDPSPRRRATPH